MDIAHFIWQSIGSAVLVGLAIFFFKGLLTTRLTNAVKHEFNTKLTKVNSKLRTQESEIGAMRNGALDSVIHKQNILYENRVNAVDLLWENVLALAPAKFTSQTLTSFHYDNVMKEAEHNSKLQDFFKMIDGNKDETKDLSFLKIDKALTARPYLSELVWSLFKAYSTILSTNVTRMELIKIGVNINFTKEESTLNLVKLVLPHQTDYINKNGLEVLHYLLEELEQNILNELRKILDGKEADKESIERSSLINKAIKEATKEDISAEN